MHLFSRLKGAHKVPALSQMSGFEPTYEGADAIVCCGKNSRADEAKDYIVSLLLLIKVDPDNLL